MKKFSVEIEYDEIKVAGKLEFREKELFVEGKEQILKIKYSEIEECFTNMKGDIRLNTSKKEYTISSDDSKTIKQNLDLKLGSKSSPQIVPSEPLSSPKHKTKDDVEILEDILLTHNKFVETLGQKMITGSKLYKLYESYMDNDEIDKANNIKNLACHGFFFSMFVYIMQNIDDSERTITFFKNLYPDDTDGLADYVVTDNKEELKNFDYKAELQGQIKELMAVEADETFKAKGNLTYAEFTAYLKIFEEAYNDFVNPPIKFNALLDAQVNREKNAAVASSNSFKYFWLPLMLIIGMAIKFFLELFNEPGIVMGGGWFSIIVFVVLFIWCCVGSDGRNTTCQFCGKWASLKLTSDKIIDHENSWRTKTEYRNGNSYRREVPVRIDLHEKHFKCDNCGNEEVRYIREEHDL